MIVGFSPISIGGKTASLAITNDSDNASPVKSISLSGTGIENATSILSLTPDMSYDFGNVTNNGQVAKSFLLSNQGTASLSVTDISITGTQATQFSIVSPSSTSFKIPAGSSQEVIVGFSPTSIGGKTASLSITNNSDNASPMKSISLSGLGSDVSNLENIITEDITSITENSAQGGGNVTDDGGNTVTARGVCWSSSSSTPTTSNYKTTNGSGTGSFTSSLTGLRAETNYYVRAYATNSEGTFYGDAISFTTIGQPSIFCEYYRHEIDDDNITSIGNNNGMAQPGEFIEMPVTLINTGTADANNVTSVLSTTDPYINITDNEVTFGAIISGSNVKASDFYYEVLSDCPERDVTFTLVITSDEGSWEDQFVVHIYGNVFRKLTLESAAVNGTEIMDSAPEFTVSPGESIEGTYNVLFETSVAASNVFPLAATPNWGNKQNDYWQDYNDMSNGNKYSGSISLTAPTEEGAYYIILSTFSEYNAGQIVSATYWGYGSLVWDDGNDLFDLSESQILNGIDNGSIPHLQLRSDGNFSDQSYGVTAIKINVSTPTLVNLEYESHEIDDDNTTSIGDDDGIVESGESIEMVVTLINSGTSDANNVRAILSCSDSDITISDDREFYGTIAEEGNAACAADYDFAVSVTCPEKDVTFTLSITSDEGSWTDQFVVHIVAQSKPSKPISPSPSDGETGQLITVDLSWSNGGGATSYDVYFGTDASPDNGDSQGSQLSTSYNPGSLDYATKYYWRLDAINSTDTTTGDVWSFTTEVEPVPLPSKPTNLSPSNGATNISIDADLSWSNGGDATSYVVYFGTDSSLDSGASQGSQSSTSYTPGSLDYGIEYFWQIDAVNSTGTTTGDIWSFTTEAEPVPLPSKPINLSPGNDATNISIDANLSWSNGGDATSYVVYFGTDSSPESGDLQGSQTNTSYNPGSLDYGIEYFWQIDAVNLTGTTTGDIWQFTTENATGFIDMNEVEGLLIYPNPTNDFLILEMESPIKNFTYFISDISGKILLQNNIENSINKENIDVSFLQSGTYILKISGEEFISTQKFVIK